jgi:DNA-binding transcriptional ArsR family regulator
MTTFDEILEVTGLDKEVLGNYLDILGKEGIVKSKIENGKIYYRSF